MRPSMAYLAVERIVIGKEQGTFRILDGVSSQHAVVCLAHNALQSHTPIFLVNQHKNAPQYLPAVRRSRDSPEQGNIGHAWGQIHLLGKTMLNKDESEM